MYRVFHEKQQLLILFKRNLNFLKVFKKFSIIKRNENLSLLAELLPEDNNITMLIVAFSTFVNAPNQ